MLTETRGHWPAYTPGPLDGPGCGVTGHDDSCLCDVQIPAAPTSVPYRRMWGSSLAEEALNARGLEDTPLNMIEQILALHDKAQEPRVREIADQAEHVVALVALENENRGEALRVLFEQTPLTAVDVSLLSGTPITNVVALAFCMEADDVAAFAKQVKAGKRPSALDETIARNMAEALELELPPAKQRRTSADDVAMMRWMASQGIPGKVIAETTGYTEPCVSYILRGKRRVAA